MKSLAFASMIALGVVIAEPAAAQTWSGLGADNNWSTGANWVGGVAPASGNTTVVTFPPISPRLSPVVDLPWTINRLDLGSAAGHSFSGQPITLAGVAPGIGATNTQQVANAIVLTGATSIVNTGFLHLDGVISGSGPVAVGGPGPVTMAAINTYTGGTTVGIAAILRVTGSVLGPVSVDNFARLAGPGTVNGAVTVISGGFIWPGVSPGVLNTGNLAVAGFVDIDINGPAQGTQYNNLNVTGTVDLSGARLELSGAYVPVPGDVFTIITNDGTDAVTGAFVGLAEGATVTFNGVPLRISYVGGTGNDVTLSAPAAAVLRQVPTLSEWALMLLAALMLGIGIFRAPRV